jgi:hypothetical protein
MSIDFLIADFIQLAGRYPDLGAKAGADERRRVLGVWTPKTRLLVVLFVTALSAATLLVA